MIKHFIIAILTATTIAAAQINITSHGVKNDNQMSVTLGNIEIEDDQDLVEDYGNFKVFGNLIPISDSEIETLISDKSKIYIFYNLETLQGVEDKSFVFENNCVIIYYKNNQKIVLKHSTNELNKELVKIDVKNFINDKLQHLKREVSFAAPNNEEVFTPLYEGSFRKEHKPYGYVDCDFAIKKYRANNVSSLYLVESDFAFTPGSVAIKIGGTGYENCDNSGGYVKIKAEPAMHEVGYNQKRYGGTPVYKDAFPLNSPGMISIGSTYTRGINLGYSFNNGFSLTDISVGSEYNIGANISYSYNKVYTNVEPSLSTQKDPNDVDKYTWVYNYETVREETNHMNLGYLFEMNNYGHQLLEGDLAVLFEYQMEVQINDYNVKSFSGSDYNNYY